MNRIDRNFHTHTYYCDGANSPEEMIQRALELDFKALGFSGHSYTSFDEEWCMTRENTVKYKAEIAALKEKYAGIIDIYCGVEQDYFSVEETTDYDYVIGSVHYVLLGDEYVTVDYTGQIMLDAADKYFGGDIMSLCEKYYETVADVVNRTGCDIIGHFDVLTKFNDRSALIDESDPRYIAAWQNALDALIPAGVPFEINTGAIGKGYRKVPYPSADILKEIKRRGGSIAISSDSHKTSTLDNWFEEARKLALDTGFESYATVTSGGIKYIEL
jgi:histidinol-phosphatase (PHP family)